MQRVQVSFDEIEICQDHSQVLFVTAARRLRELLFLTAARTYVSSCF